ncbi:DUF456 domain-containing protein [Desulfolithobacter sp.]
MPDSILAFFHATLGNSHLWGFLAAIPFIVAGFVGVLLPVLPGTVMIFCGFLLYGFITGFDGLPLSFFIGQLTLVGLSYLVDFLATALGVRMYGGSKAAAWGAVLGSLLVFVIGPLGILVGPLLGAIAGELLMGEEVRQALHAGLGSFLGFIGGTLAKLVICTIMVAWFVIRIS